MPRCRVCGCCRAWATSSTGAQGTPLRTRVSASAAPSCAASAAAPARRLSLAGLRDEPFVLFSRQVSPDYHARIIDACADAGFDPKVRHELRHWLSVVALVSQGMGVAIVPEPLAQSGIAGVVFRPLSGTQVLSTLQCVWPQGPARSPALAAMLRAVFGAAAPGALGRVEPARG